MKNFWTLAIALLLVTLIASPSFAQKKMNIGVGADILLPTGTFGDGFSIGFGGSARFQYDFTPMIAGGLNAGYYTWTAKSITGSTVKPTFSGIPIRVFGKYYFMPEGKARVYGMLELGLFFWSSKVTFAGIEHSTTGSDFNLCPEVGVEFPLGSVNLDIAAQYDIIMTTGNSVSNIGARVGVVFPIGN